jgi:hypothetical protein
VRAQRAHAPRRLAESGQRHHQPRPHLELGALDLSGAGRPGEGGQPGFAVVGGPGLVLEQRDRPPPGARGVQVQDRAHEAAAAQSVPAAGDLDPVLGRALEALELEVDFGGRRARDSGVRGHRPPA